jgi:hypothetical protein
VKIVPEPLEVHVKPGKSVAIGARLNDAQGAPRSGTITATDGSAGGTVRPSAAQADPKAAFTYIALPARPPGGVDKVTFRHVSKQGKASAEMTVIYDDVPHLPTRFEGTWTRTFEGGPSFAGFRETVQGTAVFVRNPLFGPELDGYTSIPYDVESASISWVVSGSEVSVNDPDCMVTYSGSGSEPYDAETWGEVRLTLQDVTGSSAAPQPEPAPYYYSVRAQGDSLNPPKYNIAYTAGCNETNHQEGIVTDYLDIGFHGVFGADSPSDEIIKSADPALLEGSLSRSQPGYLPTHDEWRFTG